jgi:hypothetical protein
MRAKADVIAELQALLHELFVARSEGVSYPRIARAHGYVDGLMRGLIESGLVTKAELLTLVAAERARVSGPATREVGSEEEAEGVAA